LPATRDGGVRNLVGGLIKSSDIDEEIAASLRDSGFTEEEIDEVSSIISSVPDKSQKEIADVRDTIMRNKPNSTLSKICTEIKINETVMNELWEEVIKKFLERNTTYAGAKKQKPDRNRVRWGNRRTLGHNIMTPYHPKTSSAPQNINILVDVSGSINVTLLHTFATTIYSMCKRLQYSGVWLYPWADRLDAESGLYIDVTEEITARELINRVDEMVSKCKAGGGTDFRSCTEFMLNAWRTEPQSVWLVLTDGEMWGTESLVRLLGDTNKFLFVVYQIGIKSRIKESQLLRWCIDPRFNKITKVYIDLAKDNY